ncbi:MAG TPA: glycosyltransferase family 2 protein [Anaerolineae bacterium]|nr:glycosyltransferase family 2 protein [Anaerolineae bacterium]HPL26936.1 glycosyltransferase family 2 protein [Anaerolineae bacterium]
MSTLVSVIIPNWNGARHLPTCLDALRRQTHPALEVIVVDNASADESQSIVATRYPEVRLLALPENRGFAGGVNAGIAASRGEIVALLNNDTEAEPQWAAELARALAEHPDAGAAASKMRLFDRRDTLHAAGDVYRADGLPANRGVWQRDTGQFDREEYVFGGCGGAVAYRRALLEQVGLLDEAFFFNCEDVDLAWRAQLAGWRCIYVPSAVVYHHLSATGGGVTASYYTGRNTLWVLAKDVPGPVLRRHCWPIVRAQLRISWEALKAWRGAAARARLRGQLAGLLGLPRMLGPRRRVQATRRIAIAEVERLLEPVP